ncbi:MAG TPA: hypothetical protein PK110_13075 [Niabella sp.]|jgi:hypothetical protein|nr:hypothetical protein [Chitinophagaceae bacterium]HRN47937.1 hypothetical protein [Niabella sp.]HRO85751.1 hypothetical protein [Niabella sp.]HUN01637.1 hypothetical protein [Niabella sp.]
MNQKDNFEQLLSYLQDNPPVQPNAEETADTVITRIKNLPNLRPAKGLYFMLKKLTIAAAAVLIAIFCYQTYFESPISKNDFSNTKQRISEYPFAHLAIEPNNIIRTFLLELKRNELKTNYSQVIASKFQKKY